MRNRTGIFRKKNCEKNSHAFDSNGITRFFINFAFPSTREIRGIFYFLRAACVILGNLMRFPRKNIGHVIQVLWYYTIVRQCIFPFVMDEEEAKNFHQDKIRVMRRAFRKKKTRWRIWFVRYFIRRIAANFLLLRALAVFFTCSLMFPRFMKKLVVFKWRQLHENLQFWSFSWLRKMIH